MTAFPEPTGGLDQALSQPSTPRQEGAVPRLNHFGLTVADLNRSMSFYRDLGFEPIWAEPLDLSFDWNAVIVGHKDAHSQVMLLSMDGSGTLLELLQYLHPVGETRTPLSTNDAGSAHVCVEVDDVRAEYARLSAAGVKFVSEPITVPDGEIAGTTVVYGVDPDGNVFELISDLPLPVS